MNPLKTETTFPQLCLINCSVFLLIAEVATIVPQLGAAARLSFQLCVLGILNRDPGKSQVVCPLPTVLFQSVNREPSLPQCDLSNESINVFPWQGVLPQE